MKVSTAATAIDAGVIFWPLPKSSLVGTKPTVGALGLYWPESIDVRAELDDGVIVEYTLRLNPEGVYRSHDLRVLGPFDAKILRALGVGLASHEAVAQATIRVSLEADGKASFDLFSSKQVTATEVKAALRSKPSARPQPATELELVANTYRKAVKEGRRDATEQVARAIHVSRPTAARRVAEARKTGLLGKADGTKAGER
jgi:hypothetical protein